VHRVFPSSYNYFASSQKFQFRWINLGDSEKVVTPFMQDGTYPPKNFATLGPSGIQPPFTVAFKNKKIMVSLIYQHRAGVSLYTSFYKLAKTCVFSKQSLFPIFSILILIKNSLSRSYRVNLPSSFKIIISITLVYPT